MKRTSPTNLILAKAALIVAIGLAMNTAGAALTDLASEPLSKSGSSVVKPNLMLLLDDSGSMDWNYMPDSVNDDPACKTTGSSLTPCNDADPPRYSAQFNGIYYNPAITYTPAVKYDGTSYPSYTTWTAVPNDAFGIQFSGTTDLTINYGDNVWCNTNSPSTSDRSPPFSGACRQPIQAGVWTYPNGTYNRQFSVAGTNPPYYYTISSLAWCSSKNAGGFGTGTCQVKKTATFQYPKYGTGSDGFTRTQIVPGTTTYPRVAQRTECSGAVGATGCTYAEEMTNFANWYSYYRTRMQMMKTASGLSFKQVTDSFRVGFMTIHPGSPVTSAKFLPIADFTAGAGGQKDKWYTKFYSQDANSGTPLREALSRVGRYYGHVTTGINNGITDDPVQYSCQQNFTIMSTDGFWNGNAGQKLDDNAIGNQDSDPVAAPRPMLDGPLQTTTTTTNATLTQQVCTANATVFGATACGCAANFKRVKQQTTSAISTVITIDGVLQSTTPSSSTTYQDITACNAVVTTTVTPMVSTDERVVVGNAATTFAAVNGIIAGANTTGSCGANFAGKIKRTTDSISTVVTTGGVPAGAVPSGATYSFAPVGACVALTNTVVTRFTVVQEQTLTAAATSTFASIAGAAGGPTFGGPGGPQVTSGCAANRARLYRRTSTYDQTAVTVGAGAPTYSFTGPSYGAPASAGGCTDLTSTTTTPVVEGVQKVCSGSANTTFAAAGNGLNSQIACGCTGTKNSLRQRAWGYNRIVTTVGTGAPTTSYTTTSGPTHTVVGTACTTAVPPITLVPNPQVINGAPSTVVTGAPVAAPTSNSSVVTSNTTSGSGLTAAASTGPNPSGPPTSTSTGATITSADFTITPNPKTVTSISSTSVAVGYADTLADVAQYYYYTDLRAPGSLGAPVGLPLAPLDVGTNNNVRTQSNTDVQNDIANWQHMTTFTLGLGVDGTLTYDPNYRDTPAGDFLAIKNGSMNWPQPVADTPTAVDDLWHAAVNGRGRYFSAKDPAQLVNGLTKALTSLKASFGSASAAATSNLRPVPGDNFAYVASFQTGFWDGDLEARPIDPDTGVVSLTATWKAQPTLDTLAAATTGAGSRIIKRFNAGSSNKLQDFTWANLIAAERVYFSAATIGAGSAALSQWSSLTATDQANAAGSNLVNFIRGDKTFNAVYYRDRTHVLGDIVNGAPVYVKLAQSKYVDVGYSSPAGASFADCINVGGAGCSGIFNGPRASTVYVAANDGMLHAFNGSTGDERWAYVPNILMPQLYRLADKNYVHQFYADGSPTVADVYDSVAGKWKTILVGGLNSGGRGYYALDVTDPAAPIGLWEFNVRTTGSCTVTFGSDKDDCDLGLTFGNPIVTKLANGTWVVVMTSGYNNVSPGDGKGYVYVLNPMTGVILKKIQAANASQPSLLPGSANTGNTTTTLGLAKINAWIDDAEVDNTTLRIYGGDLLGNLWRFNLDTGTAYAIAQFTDTSGVAQSVTTKPELADVNGDAMVFTGTGRYLGTSDVSSTQRQTVYGIKDVTNGVAPTTPIDARGGTVVTQTLTNSLTTVGVRTLTGNAVDLATKNGWRVDLPDSGERVNIDMQLILGTLIVGSNVPTPTVCEPSGISWLNFLDYKTGGAVQAGGFSGVSSKGLIVGFSPIVTSSGRVVGIIIKDDNTVDKADPQFATPSTTGRRSSWRELQ